MIPSDLMKKPWVGIAMGSDSDLAVMQEAANAGAKIVKPAQDAFWGGYSGYFQDPDGHLWEVVWNPDMMPQD